MTGKEKCRILKDIRRQIALENDIQLVIEECSFKGECRGTCPRCESEVRYLEAELEKRRSLKKKIALAGISAGVVLGLSGCAVVDAVRDAVLPDVVGVMPTPPAENVIDGEVEMMGEFPYEDMPTILPDETELPMPMGTMMPTQTP